MISPNVGQRRTRLVVRPIRRVAGARRPSAYKVVRAVPALRIADESRAGPLLQSAGSAKLWRMEKRTLEQLASALAAVSQDLAGRVEELANKSSAGTLTSEERTEYGDIVRLNDLLSSVRLQVEELESHRVAS